VGEQVEASRRWRGPVIALGSPGRHDRARLVVMTGLGPVIHDFLACDTDVDAVIGMTYPAVPGLSRCARPSRCSAMGKRQLRCVLGFGFPRRTRVALALIGEARHIGLVLESFGRFDGLLILPRRRP
jgi:hypothetical protein